MTPDQLNELEKLSERWANDPWFEKGEKKEITDAVMDLLPEVLTTLKSDCGNVQCKQVHSLLNALLASMGVFGREDEVSAVKALRVSEHIKQLTAERDAAIADLRNASELQGQLNKAEHERDAAQKAAAELLSWATMIANDARDCAAYPETLSVTLHKWLERDHQPDKPWGAGYVHVSEWEPVVEALRWCADHCGGYDREQSKQALAHAEKLQRQS